MNLAKKKKLAARALGVGETRILFLAPRLEEIKEAITKQDIRDLKEDGAIIIRDVKGKKKIVGRKRKRKAGKIKVKVNKRKKEYVAMVRKQRKYVAELKRTGKLGKEEVSDLRKKIRNKFFRSKAHLREYLGGSKK